MGSIFGHRIDYNGVRASGTYPAKINPSTPLPPTQWVPRHYGQEHFTVVLEMIANEKKVKRLSLITFSCYFSHLGNDRS